MDWVRNRIYALYVKVCVTEQRALSQYKDSLSMYMDPNYEEKTVVKPSSL